MKTSNYFRNAALVIFLGLSAMYSYAQGLTPTAENTEFVNAGYWIDAVVVTYDKGGENKDLLADKGFYIDPVVITYYKNQEDKELFADKGYFIDPVVVVYNNDREINEITLGRINHEPEALMASLDEPVNPLNYPGYWIDPVVITYNPNEQYDIRPVELYAHAEDNYNGNVMTPMKEKEGFRNNTLDAEGNSTNMEIMDHSVGN